MIATTPHITNKEAGPILQPTGNTQGFIRIILEDEALAFVQVRDGNASNEVLDFLIYGIFMFPNIDNFIDMTAICVFLTKSPIPTLLTDVYYSLHPRHKKRGGTIICCAPLLYLWFASYLPKKDPFDENQVNFK